MTFTKFDEEPFIDTGYRPDTGNAIDNENKARKEIGLPERKINPEHKE